MLRLATQDDFPIIKDFLQKFIQETAYKNFPIDKSILDVYVKNFLANYSNRIGLLIFHEDQPVGLAAFECTTLAFAPIKLAREVALWIDKDYRNNGYGKEVIGALEYWAKMMGCYFVQLGTLEKDYDTFYKENGYKKIESIYIKELN